MFATNQLAVFDATRNIIHKYFIDKIDDKYQHTATRFFHG